MLYRLNGRKSRAKETYIEKHVEHNQWEHQITNKNECYKYPVNWDESIKQKSMRTQLKGWLKSNRPTV